MTKAVEVFVCTLFVAWLGAGLALYLGQRVMLYPGTGAAGAMWADPPAGYQVIEVMTADGLTARALYHPAAPDMKTILFFHGNGDTVEGSARIVAPLVTAGYGAYLVEFRGYYGNPRRPTEAGLYADGEAAMRKLVALGVAPANTIVIGYSLGTGIASKVAAEHQPAATVMIAAFTGVDDVAQGHFRWLPAHRLTKDRYPTRDRIAKVRPPLLLVHGANDRTVPPANSRALVRLNPHADLIIVADQGHVVAYDPVAARLIIDWLRSKHL